MKNKLGQNFLIDEKTAKREVEYADISKDDVVLEIGPGKGILTKILAEKAKKVIAVEIDEKLFFQLKPLVSDNVELIHSDILKIDLKNISGFNKVVANLPFQISSPITFQLLDYDFDVAILIYQKEFAERMVAKSGSKNYSRLSVNVYYKADCEILETIPSSFFKPVPKIDSCIVKLVLKKQAPFEVRNKKFFFELTKKLFTYRRKKIKTIIKKYYTKNLKDIPFLENRVEDLSPDQIGLISNHLINKQTLFTSVK